MPNPTQLTAVVAAVAVIAATVYLSRRRSAARDRARAGLTAADAARRDDVTGLGDRTALLAVLAGHRRPAAVVLINLDGSRAFINHFGHRAFDQLLVLATGRLRHVASNTGATVFRLRRDELAVVLGDPAGAAGVAARLVAVVGEPTDLQLTGSPVTVTVTCCAGLATVIPDGDSDPQLTLIRADRAMRHAKLDGRGRYATADPVNPRTPGGTADHGIGGDGQPRRGPTG